MFRLGSGLGRGGAAFASGLSTAVVFLLFVLVLFRKRSPIRISLKERFSFERTCLSAVWRLGLPVALERATVSVAQIIITAVITGIGTTAVAANHLAVTAESISYLPAYGVAVAATTLVGQAVGAGRKDLAKRFARLVTWIGILVMTFGGLLLFCLAPQLIRIFTSESEVVALGTQVLRIVAFAETAVRRIHRRLRCPARRRGFQRAFLHQPRNHVGRAYHPFLPAGRQPGA